jgi:segregation and condensation protein A
MPYEVKTRVFEGPLDLLLQLITSHQVAITDLSLTDLVAEYLAHLDAMLRLDLEVTSEFLLIAATLIQLKARHLLPGDLEVDLDEELALAEERDRLLSRLLACLTFKDVAAVLAHRMDAAGQHVARDAGLDPGIVPAPPELSLDVTPAELAAIAERVFASIGEEPDTDHLDLDLPSVQQAMADIQTRLSAAVATDFESLVEHCTRPVEVVAYFLAMLELARWGLLSVSQVDRDATIEIRYDEQAAARAMETMLEGGT